MDMPALIAEGDGVGFVIAKTTANSVEPLKIYIPFKVDSNKNEAGREASNI
jgi:hypothetical protein